MALPACLQGVRPTRVVLVCAMVLSIVLNLGVLSVYMHGAHRNMWSRAALGARPNATQEEAVEEADEATTRLIEAEQRAELLLAQLLDASERSGAGAAAPGAARRAAAAAARPAAKAPPPGVMRWLLDCAASLLFGLLRCCLLLAPGVLAAALALGTYLSLLTQPTVARRLKCAATCTSSLLPFEPRSSVAVRIQAATTCIPGGNPCAPGALRG